MSAEECREKLLRAQAELIRAYEERHIQSSPLSNREREEWIRREHNNVLDALDEYVAAVRAEAKLGASR